MPGKGQVRRQKVWNSTLFDLFQVSDGLKEATERNLVSHTQENSRAREEPKSTEGVLETVGGAGGLVYSKN